MDSKEQRVFPRRKEQREQSPTQYTWGRKDLGEAQSSARQLGAWCLPVSTLVGCE